MRNGSVELREASDESTEETAVVESTTALTTASVDDRRDRLGATAEEMETPSATVEEIDAGVGGISTATSEQAETAQRLSRRTDEVAGAADEASGRVDDVARATDRQASVADRTADRAETFERRTGELNDRLATFEIGASTPDADGSERTRAAADGGRPVATAGNGSADGEAGDTTSDTDADATRRSLIIFTDVAAKTPYVYSVSVHRRAFSAETDTGREPVVPSGDESVAAAD